MAVLKDLIVHGSSRFLNAAYYNKIKADNVAAKEGIFNKIVATTGEISSLTVEDLTANRATVLSLLDVRGELHTNQWTNSNIATIDGSFYITPTIGVPEGTMTTTTNSVVVNGSNFPVSSLYVNDVNKDNTANTVAWTSGSKVLVTGEILVNGIYMPLGTLVGVLDGNASSTQIKIKSITDNRYQTAESLAEIGTQSTALPCRNVKVSLYQTSRSSTLYPLGIFMTALGENGKTFLDIYGGGYSTATATAGGFAKPVLRIGNLAGLPTIGAQTPTGYGIYTSNGYFSGTVAAKKGIIGDGETAWTIGSGSGTGSVSYIYAPTSGPTSKTANTVGMYVGTDGINNYASNSQYVRIYGGKIYAQGADIAGKITASSGSIAGWRIESTYLASGEATSPAANILLLSPSGTSSSYTVAGQAKTGWMITAGTTFGVNKDGGVYATSGKIGGFDIGTSNIRNGNITGANNTSVAGVYLGTDGLNISGGSAASTAYIYKNGSNISVNIGNKLTWNGTTLAIDGAATIGGTAASTVVSNAANGASAKESIDNLEIGGRNLVRHTTNPKANNIVSPSEINLVDTDGWYKFTNNGTLENTTDGIKFTSSTTANGIKIPLSQLNIISGTEKLTLSFKYRTNCENWVSIYLICTTNPNVNVSFANLTISETDWVDFKYTFSFPTHGDRIAKYLLLGYVSVANKWLEIKNGTLKLEKGNRATDWTPAPEDVDVHRYVTEIDSNGIWVTPSGKKPTNTSTGAGATGTRINGDGMQIFNGGTQVASYGSAITIGQTGSGKFNTYIDGNGIYMRKATTKFSEFTDSAVKFYDGSGVAAANITAQFSSDGAVIGKISSYHTALDSTGMIIYNNENTIASFSNSINFYDGIDIISQFSSSGATIGKLNQSHSIIDSNGQRFYGGSSGDVLLANIGYGTTYEDTSFVVDNPYYTFGRRREPGIYNPQKTYYVGFYCIREISVGGKTSRALYRCKTNIPNGEAWTNSHWEQLSSNEIGSYSIAEGVLNIVAGYSCHSEGTSNAVCGRYNHVEGQENYVSSSGEFNHVQGQHNDVRWGRYNFVTGSNHTIRMGAETYSDENLVAGIGNDISGAKANTIIGKYATTSLGASSEDPYGTHPFKIGNGTANSARSDALTVDWQGNVNIASGAKYKINGTALSASDVGAVPTSRTVNSKALSSNITLSASDVSAVPTSDVTTSGEFGKIPKMSASGVLDIGQYLDFHASGGASDYDVRLSANAATSTGGGFLHINGQPMKDFVIGEGTTSSWYYRKWNSGKIEAWRNINAGSQTPAQWVTGWYYKDYDVSIPNTIFSSAPTKVLATNNGSDYQFMVFAAVPTSATNIRLRLVKPNSGAATPILSIYASNM